MAATASQPPNMRSSTASTSSWVPKPLRLRSACDACHASKVRCTGQNPCARCREYGKTCEFKVSMVGRSSKNKRQHKQAGAKSASAAPSIHPPSATSSSHPASPTSLPPALQTLESGIITPSLTIDTSSSATPGAADAQLLSSPTSLIPQDFDSLSTTKWTHQPTSISDQAYANEASVILDSTPEAMLAGASPSCFGTEFLHQGDLALEFDMPFDPCSIPNSNDPSDALDSVPVGDTNTLELDSSSKTPSCPYPQNLHVSKNTSERIKAFSRLGQQQDFPHITALGNIIELLERYIHKEMTGIDEVMRVNKICLAEIAEIMGSQIFKHCKSCKFLTLTAMDLIITFYEMGVSKDSQTGQNKAQGGRAHDTETPSTASLRFGVFQFEDNASIRQQIIRHELERCIQLMQSQWTELRGYTDSEPITAQKLHRQWFASIETRAKTLSASLQFVDTVA